MIALRQDVALDHDEFMEGAVCVFDRAETTFARDTIMPTHRHFFN